MALDPVPWFVGSGAKHSAATARNLAWNATGGKTGIATPESLHVRQTSTPGGNVQIMPGGMVMESTYAGALQQSYTVRNASATEVEIPPNNTDSTVTRHVSVIIKDPTYAGSNPPSVEDGPYVEFRVASVGQSVHPESRLAKIVQPPHTTTVNDSMITDLRVLANPRREEVIFGRPRLAADNTNQMNLGADSDDGGEYFPGGAGTPNEVEVDVPTWANRVMIEADWMSVRYAANSNPFGTYWIEFGDEFRDHTWDNGQQWEYATQRFAFNSPGVGNVMQVNWRLMDAKPIVSHLRGETCTFAFKAGRRDGTRESRDITDVSMNGHAGLGLKLTFVEVPDDNPDIV